MLLFFFTFFFILSLSERVHPLKAALVYTLGKAIDKHLETHPYIGSTEKNYISHHIGINR